ncbi:MAG TPA: DUF6525 family protein [Shinella sp.]|jgi:hypothetical protein|uniref:DUF6525 family protein n=1 Tax=Shinella sp. TaxID=1870904 RepID=UPI002E0F3DF6|nr:DUF6525 family protein [Shinella sp.]
MKVVPPDPASVRTMTAFDTLPAPVRAVLNYAAYPFPVSVAKKLLRHGRPAKHVAVVLSDVDRRTGWKGGAA